MGKLISSFERAQERFDAHEIGTNFRASDDIFHHSAQRSDGMRVRITTPAEYSGTKKAITKWDWERSLALSRQLFARVGEISGAIQQKAIYAIGDSFCPRFLGQDQEWGRAAEDYLEGWMKVANHRGEPFDFTTSLYVDSIAIDRDGDAAMLTVKDGDEPRIQFVHAGAIGFRQATGQDLNGYGKTPAIKASGNRFAGLPCYNGAVFQNGKVVGYGILGETAEDDRIRGIEECQLNYEPQWCDQGRGIPAAATSLLSWMDYEDIHFFLKRQVKQDSAQGLLHYNEEGAAEDSQDFITGKDSGAINEDVKIEQKEGNEILYFKAMGGGKLEPFNSTRPHPNVDAFTMRILRGCLQSMGWFYELYDPSQVGGASTRLIQDQARASIRRRQRSITKRFIRAITHALTIAMENGDVPRTNAPDWLRWEPTLPQKITVDARYDDKTKMERIKMGAGTYAALYGDEGNWWEDEMIQRIKEQKFIQDKCVEMGVDIDKVQMLTPNGNPQAPEGDDENKEDGGGMEDLKAQFDAYGVGVRAGAITPTPADEDHFRAVAGLPPTSAEAMDDWNKTKKVRKPITLIPPEGSAKPAFGAPQSKPEDEDK